ncbi:MAG TPA: LysR family transcriptional regulator, partial [Prolixibacteraceae bacterium]|nr:LysR family transcriptional regulator [Prolixibacteraceae bacterium]
MHVNNISLDLFRIFYEIACLSSISKAAEALYITQPAVSRSIRQLEQRLGYPLFFRTSRGVQLTQEGEILFHYMTQVFGFLTSAEKKIQQVHNLET